MPGIAWATNSASDNRGKIEGWRTFELLLKLPLDAQGNIHFPGGKAAWTAAAGSDEDALLGLTTLESFVPIAEMEQRRGRPLDEASVKLLARHYSDWNSLFPYFVRLTELQRSEFEALEHFAAVVSEYPASTQNAVLGEWHSLMELTSRGVQAGSIDQARGAATFKRICDNETAPDHAAKALAVLREIAGSGDLREAVAARLLRLDADRRANFERVLQLQKCSLARKVE